MHELGEDEPIDYTLRLPLDDGTTREIEMTREQALDIGAHRPIAYTARDERVLVDDDGTITVREDGRPQYRDEAA